MAFLQDLLSNIEFIHLYLFIISVIVALVLIALCVLLFRTKKKKNSSQINLPVKSSMVIRSQDIKAIAGDNVMATQLDLARAYIEMGKKQLPKKILEHVVTHGDAIQQQQAHELLVTLSTLKKSV